MPISYRSPKTTVRESLIEGRGLFAKRPIRKGEIVAIKGGHILDEKSFRRVEREIEESYIQIEENFYIGAIKKSEVKRNKLFINHSCEPNLGIRGQITFVALRSIKPGEELTDDWAMENIGSWKMICHCGTKRCRRVITGQDWKIPNLQRRYRSYFSSYIQEKINT